jgi:hypothetical protein
MNIMNIPDNDLMHITRDNSRQVNREYFNEQYGYPGIPVVFTHAFQHMAVKEKWDLPYLMAAIPEREQLEVLDESAGNKVMTLGEYIDARDPSVYYKTSRHVRNTLAEDYKPLEQFHCWYANTAIGTPRSRLSWLYVGVKGTFSEIHRDIWWTSAWNYLIKGKKLWLIYPAAYTTAITADIAAYKLGKDPERLLESGNQTYPPLICIQEAGELIYVPGNCYHSVVNLEDTISLTENFMNETNYDTVRAYFRMGSNVKNIRTIDEIIKEGFLKMRTDSNPIPYENKN